MGPHQHTRTNRMRHRVEDYRFFICQTFPPSLAHSTVLLAQMVTKSL